MTFPISLVGFTVSRREISSSGEMVGPIFIPIGFVMPLKNSICAPVSWRVRSPIQRKWADVA